MTPRPVTPLYSGRARPRHEHSFHLKRARIVGGRRLCVVYTGRGNVPFLAVYRTHFAGIKPLPPIITHPHRLSSYVRMLDESSAKFYLYVHLKRHGQLPLQHQLQYDILEAGGAADNCLNVGSGTSPTGFPMSASLEPSCEDVSRLPPPFVAAEKELRSRRTMPNKKSGGDGAMRSAASLGKAVNRCSAQGSRAEQTYDERPEAYDRILASEHLGVGHEEPAERMQEGDEDLFVDEVDSSEKQRLVLTGDRVSGRLGKRYFRLPVLGRQELSDILDREEHGSACEQDESDIDLEPGDRTIFSKSSRGVSDSGDECFQVDKQEPTSLVSVASLHMQTTPAAMSCVPTLQKFESTARSSESPPAKDGTSRSHAVVRTKTEWQREWGWEWQFEKRGSDCDGPTELPEEGEQATEKWWGSCAGRAARGFRYEGER